MKVISLFDGISCGRVALERLGLPVERYIAFEIDENPIKVAIKNYPDTIEMGSVIGADFKQFEGGIDLMIGGSPCQSLSIIQSQTRKNLDGKSKLFYEFVRALEEIKPKYFLFENVASMSKECKEVITKLLGVEPVFIDSADFSAQERPRYYWTNIPYEKTWDKSGECIKDILEENVTDKYWYDKYKILDVDLSKQICGTLDFNNHEMHKRIFNPDFKCHTLTAWGGGGTQKKVLINGRCRKLTPLEYERLQTLPDNYTLGLSDTNRYRAIGNGWTINVICHLLKGLKELF